MANKKFKSRKEKIDALVVEIKEANKDPAFRQAVREFIAFHTGQTSRMNDSNE